MLDEEEQDEVINALQRSAQTQHLIVRMAFGILCCIFVVVFELLAARHSGFGFQYSSNWSTPLHHASALLFLVFAIDLMALGPREGDDRIRPLEYAVLAFSSVGTLAWLGHGITLLNVLSGCPFAVFLISATLRRSTYASIAECKKLALLKYKFKKA
jgi:hypothetical protein